MYQLDESEINTKFNTEPFDSAVWDVVRAAGSMDAKQVQTALADRDWGRIDSILENITHQMSFYSATYVVLPYMVKLLEEVMEEGDAEHVHMLIFNLGICLATDVPGNHFEKVDSSILDDYNAAAKKLAGLTKRYINTSLEEILEMDDSRDMLLMGALAILGERELVYAAHELLGRGEIDELNLMCGGECEFFEECIDPFDEDSEIGTIVPRQYEPGKWDGKSYDDAFLWTSAIADMFGAEEQVEVLCWIYGTFTCPECRKTKRVLDYMIAYLTEE